MKKIFMGKVKRLLRLVAEAVERVGKSIFEALFLGLLFISLENDMDSMDVKRMQKPECWIELLRIVKEVAANSSICKKIADTGDWAEELCVKYLCQKYKADVLDLFGYGKGYVFLKKEFEYLPDERDKVIVTDVNVKDCVQTQIKKFQLLDDAGYFEHVIVNRSAVIGFKGRVHLVVNQYVDCNVQKRENDRVGK